MKKIIWLIGLILILTGLIYSNDKPDKIVKFTNTSLMEFLSDPLLMYNQTDWVAPFPGPSEWTNHTFIVGDTLTTFDVTNARAVYFVFADSSLAGVDTMGIKLKIPGPTTNYLYPSIMVKPLNDTSWVTNTGNVPGDSLYSASGVTTGYVWLPPGNSAFTGTFQIYRKNANAYAAKTRGGWMYE